MMLCSFIAAYMLCMILIYPIIDDVHFDHLIKMMSARLLHCKLIPSYN